MDLGMKPFSPRARIVLFSCVLAFGCSAMGATNEALLTLDRIYQANEFNAESAGPFHWRKDGDSYTTLEKPEGGESSKDLARHDAATGEKEAVVAAHLLIPPGENEPLGIEAYSFSEDESKVLIYTNSKKVWRRRTRGDYWVYDETARALTKLGGGAQPSSLMFAAFSPDGRRVCYVHEKNLYVQDLDDLGIVQLTQDGSSEVINGTFDWVYEEELDLRQGFRWSPDSRSIAFWQINTHGVKRFQLINNTDRLYPHVTSIPYPKTGERNSATRIGVVSADGGGTIWMKVPGDPREHYLARMDWAKNSDELLIQQFNRLQNTNRLYLADAASGGVQELMEETDAAWVENENEPWWIGKGEAFIWLSERDGWRHAYRVARSGKEVSLLTPGNFDVVQVEAVDATNRWLYFIASPDNPTQRYLYRVSLDGGEPSRVTPADAEGTHSYDISPNGKWAFHTVSRFDEPPVVDLISLPDHKRVRVLEENEKLRKKLRKLERPTSEFFRVNIGGGVKLDAWCIKPPGFESDQEYPVLFYVYGEPAGQTVVDRWGGRSYLWHLMLAQKGYLVMSVDNRGTASPRGREWRKCIYRQVGILSSADQAAAVRAIEQERSYVDAERVGIWGWSGGGSMTLNMIFRYPDIYQVGMAVAPVPNERYYDTIYEERYMGLPSDNADGYRRGSPITYAGQLKGDLLLVHGSGDDNVHYQGTESLINELVARNKPFSMMTYPNRTHAISEGKGTTRHLFGLLTRFLQEHLPADQ